jgi:ABC-2 type transport system permease protein
LEFSIYSESSVPRSFSREIEHFLRPALRKARIESYGIDNLEEIVKDCDVNLHVNSVKWDEQGEESISSSELSSVLGLILALAIYMFVLSYGAMIMSGVVEEKTNRIVEVIVSSCKPLELMLGKIIGVALVGFTQFAIWGILLGVGGTIAASIFGLNMSPDMMSTMGSAEAIEAMGSSGAALDSDMKEILQMIFSIDYPLILSCFVLYFIGGYLLYASLFAAFGSAVDQ